MLWRKLPKARGQQVQEAQETGPARRKDSILMTSPRSLGLPVVEDCLTRKQDQHNPTGVAFLATVEIRLVHTTLARAAD
jgi:hypothetical protein